MMTNKTYQPKGGEVVSNWYLNDADGETLGRFAANVAKILRGKHKPQFTPHMNCGDHVIVINAEKIRVTGKKKTDKIYDRYSGYPSGRHTRSFEATLARDPILPLTHAVKGMLQHNSLGADMLTRLRVYAGSGHKHEAQVPKAVKFGPLGEIVSGDS